METNEAPTDTSNYDSENFPEDVICRAENISTGTVESLSKRTTKKSTKTTKSTKSTKTAQNQISPLPVTPDNDAVFFVTTTTPVS